MIIDIVRKNENVTPNVREIAILREYFPSCFKDDGSFDIERFKEFLNDKIQVTDEGYELRFLGKKYAMLLSSLGTTTVIVPDEEHNALPENSISENIYISGDNLDGLQHLLKSYAGEVKCIYIDPPYNTGTDGFVYSDNFDFTPVGLAEKLSIDEGQAQRILDLTKRGSASHSAWLMFMYPRMLLARDLLSDDGVIFVSIDDNEQSNLKLLCDDVFGEENFIAQIVVQSNKRGQTYKQLAKTHEYVLVYTRNVNVEINELMKEIGSFTKEDGISEFSERELRNRNPKFGKFNRPNLYYPIYINPKKIDSNGYSPISLNRNDDFYVEVYPINSDGQDSCWRWGTRKLTINNTEDSFESNIVGRIKTTGEYGVYEKYRKTTYKAKTIWFLENLIDDLPDEEDGIWDENGVITEQGSVELGSYGMGDVFDFPKPTYLIKKILMLGANNDCICVDFFSGSATTADAIMQLNTEANGSSWNIKYISIQLPENLDAKLSKAGANDKPKIQRVINFLDSLNRPRTIDQIGIERILRTANSIREGSPATTADLGFRHFTLVEPSQNTIDKLEEFDPEAGVLYASNLLEEFGKPTVLTTWLIRDGYGFTNLVEEMDFAGYKAYYIDKHLYLINTSLNDAAIMAIIERYETDGGFNPENVVLFGYSFTWTERETLQTNLKRLKDTEKEMRVNYEIRY
jgi:type III restriction enzyme/adenine-specific DNA-methyltransferase